jgi:hypothetical protein
MGIFQEVRKLVHDCLTSANGDYDPARVVGYLVVVFGALEFLALSAYVTIKDGKFDSMQYSAGLVAIAGVLVAAAAGVWLKRATENLPAPSAVQVTNKQGLLSEDK